MSSAPVDLTNFAPRDFRGYGRSPPNPNWPNGAKIAFMSTRTGDGDIYAMNPNGSAQTRLTTNGAIDSEPDWSPDSTKIAFSTNRHGNLNFELYAMNASGSSQTRLTTNGGLDTAPSWSAGSGTAPATARTSARSPG